MFSTTLGSSWILTWMRTEDDRPWWAMRYDCSSPWSNSSLPSVDRKFRSITEIEEANKGHLNQAQSELVIFWVDHWFSWFIYNYTKIKHNLMRHVLEHAATVLNMERWQVFEFYWEGLVFSSIRSTSEIPGMMLECLFKTNEWIIIRKAPLDFKWISIGKQYSRS